MSVFYSLIAFDSFATLYAVAAAATAVSMRLCAIAMDVCVYSASERARNLRCITILRLGRIYLLWFVHWLLFVALGNDISFNHQQTE